MKNLIYNTVKQKLLDGKKVVGGTINTPDPDIYLEMANSGFDFLSINPFKIIKLLYIPINNTTIVISKK